MISDLQRAGLLFGPENMERIARVRVIVIGVGGVGSWCAEALVRTGVGHLTIVDADTVDITNINRQLPATSLTVGQPKVEVLARRLREIRPTAHIMAIHDFYSADNADSFGLEDYDIVIDAIDSVASKAHLMLHATSIPGIKLYSSMGAARRLDPSRIQDAEFWKVRGCPLARALRDRFKKTGERPRRKIRCVFSDETPSGEPKGTFMPVTAGFGMRLASLAIRDLISAT
ncbi:MAG: tRNA threonylcarbamoyladenosine dehydratase [Muribaculaceae bacterium]|nr:tRNA threonylcarbamoyladenosine dehydratase [Muribaculaceae bacterium]